MSDSVFFISWTDGIPDHRVRVALPSRREADAYTEYVSRNYGSRASIAVQECRTFDTAERAIAFGEGEPQATPVD